MKVFKIKWQGINARGTINSTIVKAKNKELALVKLGVANRRDDVRKIISIEQEISKTDLKTVVDDL